MAQGKSSSHETPPYISYSTFKNTLNQLREGKQLPTQIDAAVLKNLSGTSRNWLLSAFRYFGLISTDNRPTDKLRELHKASPEEEKKILHAMLEKHYPTLVAELPNGTAISLRSALPIEGSLKRRCISFFLAAAKDGGFHISPHILADTPVRQPTKRRSDGQRRQMKRSSKSRSGVTERNEPALLPSGFKRLPFPVGLKVWHLELDEGYTDEEILRFAEMLKTALLKKRGK